MQGFRKASIIGTGSYLPEKILTNKNLEQLIDTSDEWIVSRTGMRERRIASEDEHTSFMGAKAAEKAINNAEILKEEIDCIIFTSSAPDYIFPSSAALAQDYLGLKDIPSFDCLAACTGFLYALSLSRAYIEANIYNNILLIAADKLSSFVNYKDRNTCVLFGDGGAACVISATQSRGLKILGEDLGTEGALGDLLKLPAGGSRCPASYETVDKGLHFINMEGKEVFKHAVRRMESSAKNCIEKLGFKENDIDWLIPHQANERIIDAIGKRFGFSSERIFKTVHKYGNTAASSIGIALDEFLKDVLVKKGDKLLLVAFGGGLSWGSSILEKL